LSCRSALEKQLMNKPSFDVVWNRISNQSGEVFRQIRGAEFRYLMDGNGIIPDRTNHRFSKSEIKKAFARMPVENTVPLQDLRGPSYLYAILMDERIRQDDW